MQGGSLRFSTIAAAVPDCRTGCCLTGSRSLSPTRWSSARSSPDPRCACSRADAKGQELCAGDPRAEALGTPLARRIGIVTRQVPDSPQITAQDVRAIVADREIRFIRLWFTDVLGQLKSFSINASELDGALEAGMGFDGSSITGFNAIEESDMVAMPDPATFAVLPWRPEEQGVGRMFCDVLTPERTPYEGDPRHILRRAISARRDGLRHLQRRAGARVLPVSRQLGDRTADSGGYFDLTTLDAGSDVRRETSIALEALGIHVEYSHHEVGPSQHEIDMRYADALKMADDCMTYRITVKEVALKYGWHATFMPKPMFGENGSGMHTHQSLFATGATPSSTPTTTTSSRRSARRSSPASCATPARSARSSPSGSTPTSASCPVMRRLSMSPGRGATARRWCACRSITRARSTATRMELRCPDPACNPYLTFAALLQAGLEGIENGYELPEPMEKNLYHLSSEERRRLGIEQLPETLGDAIELHRRLGDRAAHAW